MHCILALLAIIFVVIKVFLITKRLFVVGYLSFFVRIRNKSFAHVIVLLLQHVLDHGRQDHNMVLVVFPHGQYFKSQTKFVVTLSYL